MPNLTLRALIGSLVLLYGMAAVGHGEDSSGIHVSGTGEVLIEPDMGRMTLQVTRQGRDPAAIKREMDAVTAAVLKLTDGLNIERKDVTAALVQIQPNRIYNDGQQRIDGVIANRSIEIVVRDLDAIPDLMNRSLELGINSVGDVQLDSSQRVTFERQALDLAIEDAKAEAARVAKGFGVRLGDVRDVQVTGQHAVQPRMAGFARAESSGDSFSAGQLTVRRDIQATFAIGGQ